MTKNKLLLGSLLLGLMLALSGCSADTREALTKKVVDTLIDKLIRNEQIKKLSENEVN